MATRISRRAASRVSSRPRPESDDCSACRTGSWLRLPRILFLNHARVADPVVKGALLIVETGHDIADAEDCAANILRNITAGGVTQRKIVALHRHDAQPNRRLAE